MKGPQVGFGNDYSRRGRTRVMNYFVATETTPVAGGADVRVTARRGFVVTPEFDIGTGGVTIRVRKDAGPEGRRP